MELEYGSFLSAFIAVHRHAEALQELYPQVALYPGLLVGAVETLDFPPALIKSIGFKRQRG